VVSLNIFRGLIGLQQTPDRARPYRHEAVFGDVPVPWSRLQYLQSLGPASGIDASISEMAHYALLQLGDGRVSGDRVTSAPMMAEMHRPQIAVGSDWTPVARIQDLHYALGWFIARVHRLNLVYHNGANPGFRATIALAPSSEAGVVILTNRKSDRFIDAARRSLLELLLR
jgi:beta-lactamase class C